MKAILKSVKVFDNQSEHHGKVVDIAVERGIIRKIGARVSGSENKINCKGMIATPGWIDTWAFMGDPGYEHKEDIYSGREAAFRGGFTRIFALPDTNPVIQSKNEVKYVLGKNGDHGTHVYPLAALTRDRKGELLTEMIDLHEHGVLAFTDAQPVEKGETLVKALRYLHKFDGVLIQVPIDNSLSEGGQMNEGKVSTFLGMKGIPNISEEISVQRDLEILRYAGGRLHFANISTPKSAELIKQAKRDGLRVTCSMAAYQLTYTDEDLDGFDTNMKVLPPFRTGSDNKAMLKYLKDGTIDIINSNHRPQDEESKKLEFDLADPGIISIQTLASDLVKLSESISLDQLLEKVTAGPSDLFGIERGKIREGEPVEITVLDPEHEWNFTENENVSKSDNSPYFPIKLKGKVRVVVNGKYSWKDEGI